MTIASIVRMKQRITYYEKIKAAVDAGYLLVPNCPIDVLAVHTALTDGTTITGARYVSGDDDEVEFPVARVKAAVLAAIQRAMVRRLFDEIGTVQNAQTSAGRDPMVVGRLLGPNGRGRCTTFFIAWWLDTASL